MPAQVQLFNSDGTPSQTHSLVDKVAAFVEQPPDENLSKCIDRWVLASNLQKSIRRGLVTTAVGTATRLLEVDPRYFWRRLLVIAYEDIGYAEIDVCYDLLKTFRREALHLKIGVRRVAQYFASELAVACKSRSLCDAIAALEFSVRRDRYDQQIAEMNSEKLLSMVADANAPVICKVAALRSICGYGEVVGGRHKVLRAPQRDLMAEVSRLQGMTEAETTLFRSGQGIAESMNVPMPVISPMVRHGGQGEQIQKLEFEGVNGILFASLDRHTRAGKRCFANLAARSGPLGDFFAERPTLKPVAILGVAVFIEEGATLNRRLAFSGGDGLRAQFNHNFLESVGVVAQDQILLMELLVEALPLLNDFRSEEM